MEIRDATQGDWSAIRRLLEASDLPTAGAEAWAESFLVAEEAGRIVGCAVVERYDGSGLLRSVAVDESMRGRRVGEAIARAAIERSKSEGLASLFLLTTTAESWFPRFGFRRIRRDELPPELADSQELQGACPATAVAMALNLA